MTPGRHAAARDRSPSWWAGVVEWRNWRLPVKMGAVLVVPALLAVALGVVQIQRDVQRANSYADVQRLVKLRDGLMPLIGDLQMERTMSAERLRGGGSADPAMLRRQNQRVDRAQAAVAHTTERAHGLQGVTANRYRDAFKLLDQLPALRAQVTSKGIGSWTAVTRYSKIINSLLDLDQALGSRFGEPQLSGPATALYDLELVQEQVHLQHVIVTQAPEPGRLEDPKLIRALVESDIRMRDNLSDFRAVAAASDERAYQRTVTGPEVERRTELLDAVMSRPAAPSAGQNAADTSPPFSVRDWNRSSEATGTLIHTVEKRLADRLRVTSAKLQDETSDRAGAESVLLFAVLLLALAIGIAIARHLLRSLTVLRSTALDVAERRLPEAVSSIREGEVSSTSISAVPVHTTEEFGQLARAFDAVHGQAVRLAAEQAALRGDLRDTLVNLSRRSQSLVDRLLRLMEQLESHEEDPDQLASLFKLDHLATRMRRNNENLMVLCGSTPVRPSEQRVPLDSVLRAAVSEIEHYRRVVVQPVPEAEVIGYAAGDLARMIAELLDNATAFSPPETQVIISNTLRLDGSALIEVRDEGFGMSGAELAKAHRRVAGDASVEVPTSRQMGLTVVGRLARRHGLGVELISERDTGGGLRAGVLVPAKLMLGDRPALTGGRESALPVRRASARTAEPARAHREVGGVTAAPLPRRTPDAARSLRAGDSPAASGHTGRSLPTRPRAFADPQQDGGGLPRRTPPGRTGHPAKSGHPGPVGEGAPERTGAGSGNGAAPADRRAQRPPGQPTVPPQRSRPPAQDDAPSPWFASAASENTPQGPPGEERPDGRGPVDLPAAPAPRRPAPAESRAPDDSGPDAAAEPGRIVHDRPGVAEAGGTTPAGLPRRMPRQRPVPDQDKPRATGDRPTPRRTGDEESARRNAGRTHTFLSNYQSGIRRAQPDGRDET
ncbi:nitrate- and nitrite sensing domain-containing protein [Streptomyces sp. DR7-3]|uniref:nitrate- and nitrite sensing domain-containing protein n=1 Tax=Streptomyces malaysiensis TaxID=92644 RepID=UPI002042CAE6|nr:nitrate- and nitrite sensing domain-containing protein [Streptomyces sp. DR7-3]MCM3805485.1 nitrate- and nitrite sensing domain-containing protein [Streptomyces sp. DR7-3]